MLMFTFNSNSTILKLMIKQNEMVISNLFSWQTTNAHSCIKFARKIPYSFTVSIFFSATDIVKKD